MSLSQGEIRSRAGNIRLALFDVDGVLTDGRLYLDAEGKETRTSHLRDGHGLKLLAEAGIVTGVISGRPAGGLRNRLGKLGMQHLYFETDDKVAVFDSLLDKLGLQPEQASFMGDDTPDLPLLQRCGLALAVADAHEDVLATAHWISDHNGGMGAARQACDLLLGAQQP